MKHVALSLAVLALWAMAGEWEYQEQAETVEVAAYE